MIGTRLGQYRIEALLGQGGMGAVYLATDEMLGRQVAIKVLREQAEGHGIATERFRSEAQILSRLDHPHILRLYGFSQHESLLYMVTEYVQGEALLRRLERGPVGRDQVLAWAAHVLDALDYAHQLGVVHRDIKPANILIDERGRARLLDFGIARIVGADGLTQTGQAVGTLTYMAPEQVLDEPVDGRADIYAFAVVLCQMLAGRKPYRATTTAGLIREIVDGPQPDVAALLPPESATLAPPLMRALARFPAERTPTASQLRLELMAAAAEPALPPLPLPPVARAADVSGGTPVTPPPAPISSGFPFSSITTGKSGQATVTASTIPVAPPAQRRTPGALVLVVPLLLLLTGASLAWYLFTRPRVVAPPVAVAPPPADTPTETPVVLSEPLPPPSTPDPTTIDDTMAGDVAAVGALPPAAPAPPAAAPEAPALPVRSPSTAARTQAPVNRPAPPSDDTIPSSDPGTDAGAVPTRVAEAIPPTSPSPAARTGAARPTVEFKNIILMDRIDDEDEEIDVSIRLDGRRVVVIDEDGIAKRSIAYESIERATYNTRKPGRFSFRRGPSHWLTLEVGTTPIVLRLNGKTYEQVLTTLSGRGVHVERNQ